MGFKAGVLTLSDRSSRKERDDASGPLIRKFLESLSFELSAEAVLADDVTQIRQTLIEWSDVLGCDLILTTGGTGLSPRDNTPEATRAVIEKEIPGICEALRAAGMRKKPMAMLSRGISGVRGGTLIINLPGSPKAVEEAFEILAPVLVHALELIKGRVRDCHTSLSPSSSH